MPSMIFLLTLTLLSFADPGLETECTDCDTPALPAERVLMEIPESIIKQHKAEKIPTPAGRKVPIIAGGCKVNSSFGWRKHPILKRRIHHDGKLLRPDHKVATATRCF
jgi:hypothetical protein